ncbi:MAG: NUDIX domain-containing protein [Bacteroidaceae bacterium]|nr:NUDIX domain-containing protein [Bacteroidaceae bacterium]
MNSDDNNEILPVVDSEGNVSGKILRGEAHDGRKVLHPVIHLHLFNSKGELYLQRRPDWKPIQPGKWDTACGGHISYGETIEQAFRREVMEELGICLPNPIPLGHYIFESKVECELVYAFKAVYDGPVSPSSDELDGGRFWTMKEIEDVLEKGILTPNFESEFRRFF